MKKRTGESMKDLILGEELNKSTSKTAKQHTGITSRQKTIKPVLQHTIKKATYYIKKPALIKELKLLSVEKERDLSGLVTEAIEDLIKKYKR